MTDQIPLIGPRGGLLPRSGRKPNSSATSGRVRVLLDSQLPQLDRLLDFGVPGGATDRAVVGARVKVTVAGQKLTGFIVAEGGDPDYVGPVRPLDAVVSPLPVLTDDVLQLCQVVAEHYAGGLSDVVRLAVPPRTASVELDWPQLVDDSAVTSTSARSRRNASTPLLALPAKGRGVWSCPPDTNWSVAIAIAAVAVADLGQGVLIVVPDGADVSRMERELRSSTDHTIAVLRAEDGPTVRYQNFLAALSGKSRIVIGTRSAAFAPVADLGLAIIWDDGDPSHAEPHAPYPHARDVLVLRSHLSGCRLLIAAHSRSTDAQRLVERQWADELSSGPPPLRERPHVTATDDRVYSPLDLLRRFPQAAVDVLRRGLTVGPVLIQVARAGYVPVTACQGCRLPAHCPECAGPIELEPGAARCRRCSWTGTFRCPECGGDELRAVRVGAGRTAEEVARLFPKESVSLRMSGTNMGDASAGIVVATPGLEPEISGGFAAAYLPDAQEDLWFPDARAAENAMRRWLNAAALVRAGGPVMINADPGEAAVQGLIRWNPQQFAREELVQREAAGLPPTRRLVQLDGDQDAVADLVAATESQVSELRVLGPREMDAGVRTLLTALDGHQLVTAVRKAVVSLASSSRSGPPVRVQVDPVELD